MWVFLRNTEVVRVYSFFLTNTSKEGQLILLLYLHFELYLLAKAFEVIQEGGQFCSSMGPDDESVVHVPKP